jgi:hypothetical protein
MYVVFLYIGSYLHYAISSQHVTFRNGGAYPVLTCCLSEGKCIIRTHRASSLKRDYLWLPLEKYRVRVSAEQLTLRIESFQQFSQANTTLASLHIATNSVALVRERTMPTERPPLVGEVSANFWEYSGVAWSVRRIPYGRNLGFLDRTSLEHSHKVHHQNTRTKYFTRTLAQSI